MATDLLDHSISDLAALVRGGDVTARQVTERSLERIRDRNGVLGAFLTVSSDAALATAARIDERRARGESLGPLAGVPVGIKDALCTSDAPTTAGSRILISSRRAGAGGSSTESVPDPYDGYRPPYDATVVARLRAADAVIVGKCNLDELAMGSSNENSAFFPARNPWDTTRIPGGSSGGSAVAVAARLAAGALGSDTGGSIRQPAALTGVVGIKPTYGRVPRYGLMAFASSLDQVGSFASDVRGAARILDVIAGADPRDATSLPAPVDSSEAWAGRALSDIRIGVPEEYFAEGLDPEVGRAVRAAIAELADLGATVVPVRLPHTAYAVATYYIIATAEASSNLARYDGVRFGLRATGPDASSLRALYDQTRGQGFGPEVKRRILLGTYVLSAGYYDAYYLRAQRARSLFVRDFDDAFRQVDVIATPVSPTVAFKLGERTGDPLAMYLADVYTLPASLAGLPAISVPCGLTEPTADRPRLPIGLQLIGPALSEPRLVQIAAAYEPRSPARGATPPDGPEDRHGG